MVKKSIRIKKAILLFIFILSFINTCIVTNRYVEIDEIPDGWVFLGDYLYVLFLSLSICVLSLLTRMLTVFAIQFGYVIIAFILINNAFSLYSVYLAMTFGILVYHSVLLFRSLFNKKAVDRSHLN